MSKKDIKEAKRRVLEMKKQMHLSNLSEYEGMSLRAISERTGHHFNTVKKYVDKEDWNEGAKPRKERVSRLDPLKAVIDEWIMEDLKRSRKNRRSGTKIYNDLLSDAEHRKHLTVKAQTVRSYVVKRKKELCSKKPATAMYGLHPPGYAQVDFGDVLINTGRGVEETWHELIVSFPYSNAGFAQVCRFETKECMIEGMVRIFEFIGGVPQRILFDNMSSAVVHIEENGERKLTDIFMRFTMHHRFKAEFCNPDSGHEKGNVENKVGYIRRNYLLPPPVIETPEELITFNKELLERCKTDLNREHYRKKEPINELFAKDNESLLLLPKEPFRVFTLEKVMTDKYSFIHFDSNTYSTDPAYALCEMWLEIGTTELRILNKKYELVATHKRRYKPETEPIIDFDNYVLTLLRKPRAFLSSPYFETLPKPLRELLLNVNYAELKTFLKVLEPIIIADNLGDASAVIELQKIRTADDFEAAYRALTEAPYATEQVTTPNTPKQVPYTPKLEPYAALMNPTDQPTADLEREAAYE